MMSIKNVAKQLMSRLVEMVSDKQGLPKEIEVPDETEYLLQSRNNAKHLERSIAQYNAVIGK